MEKSTDYKSEEQKDNNKPSLIDLVQESVEPTTETMERDIPKKCCKISNDIKYGCHCCIKCWSCSLNSIEGCCSITSAFFLIMSNLAIGCNKCLEYIDCDGN